MWGSWSLPLPNDKLRCRAATERLSPIKQRERSDPIGRHAVNWSGMLGALL